MKSMVVFFALASVACGSLVPLAQPPHHPAIVLDLKGRPLDTAEVINARALHLQAKALEGHYAPLAHSAVAPAVVAAPAAVSHQSRVDVISSPAVVSHAAPVWGAHAAVASPLLAHSGLGLSGHGHYLKKRSLGHLAYNVAPLAHTVVAPAVIAAPAVVAAPAAVSHQSRVDVISSPAVVSHAAPVWGAHAALASPLLAYSGLGLSGHGHYLKKRSLGHLAYNVAPVAHSVYAVAAPSAVSHQSRVDVISSPAVVSHAVAAPVVAHAVAAPLVAHVAPSAVSHQSRVDVRTSPAVVSHSVVAAPVVAAHSTWAAPAYSAHSAWTVPAYGAHGHLLKKRSLGLAHAVLPSAVSHQSRVDVISSPAVVSHAAVAYAAPVAVSAHLAPVAHSAVWTAPAHLSHSGLLHSSPLGHAALW